MSQWENWIELQQKTVEADGSHAATIKLEAPDGAVWGTWPAKTEGLCEVIKATIELLVEDLPKERFGCRLVSYDIKGEQLAIMPHAIQGRSSEVAKQANRDRAHAQATAVHLANAESVLSMQNRQLLAERAQVTELFDDNLTMRAKLVELTTATLADRTQERLQEERLQMFKELVATCKPLLETCIGFGAELASYKFSEIVKKLEGKELAKESLSTENERLKAELAEAQKAEAEAKRIAEGLAAAERERLTHAEKPKPTNGAVPHGAVRARKTPRDGARSRQGNGRRPARNRGRATPAASGRRVRAKPQ